MNNQDTIAAIATPFGTGGVGIIRISGPAAEKIAHQIFVPSQPNCRWESHHLYHGDIISADGLTVLDEVLVSLMRGPHSFTGEDILEINCHGSPLIMQSILSNLCQSGCRPARAGEFTLRAFLNNRIDLSQAEALATIVAARSEKAGAIALKQLKGDLRQEIENLRQLTIDALALLEAAIDFTDDISPDEAPSLPPQIKQVATRLKLLLASYPAAKAYAAGLNVIITGKPNVGKSSLLNTLTGKKRAIVTEIPGTTRDFITDTINIRGIPIHLMDTAGIHPPQNIIEKAGIDLVWENAANADLVIILLDGSKPLTVEDTDIFSGLAKNNYLVVTNKSDLPAAWNDNEIDQLLPDSKRLKISAKFGRGIDELKDAIIAGLGPDIEESNDTLMITSLRQKTALEKAQSSILKAGKSLACGMSPEFAAFDLHETLDCLDEITGKKINDEILDKIFSSFCIGK